MERVDEAGRGGAAGPDVEPDSPSAQAARWVFGGYVVVAVPLLLLVLADHHWFMRDDWFFITDREIDSADDLFTDHNGHWSTVPIVVFRLLWSVVGLRSYVPYQLVVVSLHLGVVVLVRVVMRRAGVGPWMATATAAALVLFGPGREDIVWAFQIGLTGAVFFALLQMVLADHDGGVGWRDGAALVAGVLAIGSSGSAVPVVVATGLTLLVRRGWARALLQTAPLAGAYGAWVTIIDPQVGSPFGRPDLDTSVDWVRNAYQAVFMGLGRYAAVAWALAAVLVGGLVLHLIPSSGGRAGRWRASAAPLALLAGGLLFTVMTLQSRWIIGPEGARASRYLYIGAVLVAPALAVAADEIARRWRPALPLLAALVLVAVPANVTAFDRPPFGPPYHAHNEALITTAVRLGDGVPPEARPLPGSDVPPNLDMGFLLQAERNGKLAPSSGSIPPPIRAELEVRLTFEQRTGAEALEEAGIERLEDLGSRCTMVPPNEPLRPEPGSIYLWDAALGGIRVQPTSADASVPVPIDGREGAALIALRGGPTFTWAPMDPSADLSLCHLR